VWLRRIGLIEACGSRIKQPRCFRTEAVFLITSIGTVLALSHWHNELSPKLTCMGMSAMFTALTAPGLTLLFLGVVVGLGTAFVWMIWEIEQASKSHRGSDHFGGAGSS
jgi:hypothetical protein